MLSKHPKTSTKYKSTSSHCSWSYCCQPMKLLAMLNKQRLFFYQDRRYDHLTSINHPTTFCFTSSEPMKTQAHNHRRPEEILSRWFLTNTFKSVRAFIRRPWSSLSVDFSWVFGRERSVMIFEERDSSFCVKVRTNYSSSVEFCRSL